MNKKTTGNLASKFISILTVMALLCITTVACQGSSDDIYNQFSSNNSSETISAEINSEIGSKASTEDTNISGKIILQSIHEPRWYEKQIKSFNEVYPNIEVEVKEITHNNFEELILKTSALIMGGEEFDIMDLMGLEYYKFARSGVFEDLYQYMEKDEGFHREDYYTNIFDMLEVNGGLYEIPQSFRFWYCRFNKNVTDELGVEIPDFQKVDYKYLADLYRNALSVVDDKDNFRISLYSDHELYDWFEYNAYFDEYTRTASFDSKDFINYIETIKGIPWPTESEIPDKPWDQTSVSDNELVYFCPSDFMGYTSAEIIKEDNKNLTGICPYVSSDGDLSAQFGGGAYAIPVHSKNKDLAWKFIKHCIEEKDYENYLDEEKMTAENMHKYYSSDGFPINRKTALKLLDARYTNKDLAEKLDETAQSVNAMSSMSNNANLAVNIGEITDKYYDELISAEICAKEAQERAEMLLKE